MVVTKLIVSVGMNLQREMSLSGMGIGLAVHVAVSPGEQHEKTLHVYRHSEKQMHGRNVTHVH